MKFERLKRNLSMQQLNVRAEHGDHGCGHLGRQRRMCAVGAEGTHS